MTIFWSIIKSICGEFQVRSTIFKHVFSSPLTSQGFHWFLQPENRKHNPLKTPALTFSWWWFKLLAIPRPLHLTPYILVVFVLPVLDQPTLKGKQPANFKQSRTIFLLSSSLYRSAASPHLFPIHLYHHYSPGSILPPKRDSQAPTLFASADITPTHTHLLHSIPSQYLPPGPHYLIHFTRSLFSWLQQPYWGFPIIPLRSGRQIFIIIPILTMGK